MPRLVSRSSSLGASILLAACVTTPEKVVDPVRTPDARVVDHEAPIAPITVESTNRETVVRAEASGATPAITWAIGNAPATESHALSVLGAPTVGESAHGPTVCFDGKDDALLFPVNPLEGLAEFTIEVLVKPDPDGSAEQRLLHVQEDNTENRALIELRVSREGSFHFTTQLGSGDAQASLSGDKSIHPATRWYWIALTYKAGELSQAVNGALETQGKLTFTPFRKGQMSLGARFNRESWFKGCVREIRISPAALPVAELQRASDTR